MKLSNQIKPISYLKAHTAEIVRNLSGQGEPLIITQNGEAKVVMQDIESLLAHRRYGHVFALEIPLHPACLEPKIRFVFILS